MRCRGEQWGIRIRLGEELHLARFVGLAASRAVPEDRFRGRGGPCDNTACEFGALVRKIFDEGLPQPHL